MPSTATPPGLSASGAPLGNTDVTLYRWAPEIAIDREPQYLLSGDRPVGPKFQAGHTRTDDRGHFAIEGDWPQSLFLLRAGNVALPIAVTPEPGDPIDLGNLAALVTGLFRGDDRLISGALVDLVAEPLRAGMTPGFEAVRRAALAAGALGARALGIDREGKKGATDRLESELGNVSHRVTSAYRRRTENADNHREANEGHGDLAQGHQEVLMG